MIIKSVSRKTKSFRQLLKYILLAEERVPEARVIIHNLKGTNIDEWTKEFLANEKNRSKRRRKNSTILTQEILSWHPLDTPALNVEIIEDIARRYIEERNPNGLYLGVIHLMQDHYHVHLCVSGVEFGSGETMRMSRKEFEKLKTP